MTASLLRFFQVRNRATKITAVLALCVLLTLYSLVRIMYQNYTINQRIKSLQQDIAYLQQNNLEQQNKILYYDTDAYVEKTLREKLNYQKEGEKIYAVERRDPEQERLLEQQRLFKEQEDRKPNLVRWWEFFFGADQEQSTPNSNQFTS